MQLDRMSSFSKQKYVLLLKGAVNRLLNISITEFQQISGV